MPKRKRSYAPKAVRQYHSSSEDEDESGGEDEGRVLAMDGVFETGDDDYGEVDENASEDDEEDDEDDDDDEEWQSGDESFVTASEGAGASEDSDEEVVETVRKQKRVERQSPRARLLAAEEEVADGDDDESEDEAESEEVDEGSADEDEVGRDEKAQRVGIAPRAALADAMQRIIGGYATVGEVSWSRWGPGVSSCNACVESNFGQRSAELCQDCAGKTRSQSTGTNDKEQLIHHSV